MGKAMTTEEFISKAKERYGDNYDYSNTNYSGMFNKVTVICPIHGEFQTIPHNHLRGAGCKRCGIERSARVRSDNKSKFIEKARKIHGDKYNYDLVEYKNSDTKVKIICSIHGVFEQHPTTHLGGHGCPKCGFINKSNKVHKGKYNYDLTNYKTAQESVKITCPIHGTFEQRAYSHLAGCGCPKCGWKLERSIKKEDLMAKNKWKVVGFCKYFMDKKDYLYPDVPYAELSKRDAADIDRAIVNFLADTDTYFVPDQHQSNELHCVPVVENDSGERYQVTFSLRAWGHIMGLAFGGDYMDYYCSRPEDHPDKIKLPDPDLYLD